MLALYSNTHSLYEAEGLGKRTERVPNVRPNVVCQDETSVTGECTEQPGNVVVRQAAHERVHIV